MNFDDAYTALIANEGTTLSTDSHDPGNWTGGAVGAGVLKGSKFGISAAAFPEVDIAHLTLEQAKALAKTYYWDRYRCDAFAYRIAYQVFDAAYNGGHPAKWLQIAAGVPVDGLVGAQTVAAIAAANPYVVVMRFLAERLDYWTSCSAWQTEGAGWTHRGADNLRRGARSDDISASQAS